MTDKDREPLTAYQLRAVTQQLIQEGDRNVYDGDEKVTCPQERYHILR